jgi:nitrogen fixation/metabolism regulation signal transduction histidine kinase
MSYSSDGEVRSLVADRRRVRCRPEDRQRIFEPFVQLDAGLTRRNEGSGLGLALVRRLRFETRG